MNIRFGKHRACMNGKINSSSCKRLSEHFSSGFCKGANFSVNIIEKWKGKGRTEHGSIDLGLAVLRRKRETEWMLKLRTVYPYGLNDKVDIYNENNQCTRFDNDDDLVGRLFPSLPRQFQRDQTYRHANRDGQPQFSYETFIRNLHQHILTDLRNASNYIRIALSSTNKKHSKHILIRLMIF